MPCQSSLVETVRRGKGRDGHGMLMMPFVANVAREKKDGKNAADQAQVSSLRRGCVGSAAMAIFRPTGSRRSQRCPWECTEAGTAVRAAAAWDPGSGEQERR
jgi:hypothetical protein